MKKVDKLIAEWGLSLPKDKKHSLLTYLATEQRDKVSPSKIVDLLKEADVDINYEVNSNSAILLAINRYMDNKVL